MIILCVYEKFTLEIAMTGITDMTDWNPPLLTKEILQEYTVFLCGSVVEHCVSSAKGCGFNSQGTHILMKMYNLNAIVSRFG